MHLDPQTLMVVGSFVEVLVAAMLIGAWWFMRETTAPLWWGVAILFDACGVMALAIGAAGSSPVFMLIAPGLIAICPALTWAAARQLDHKSVNPVVLWAGSALWLVLCFLPGLRASPSAATVDSTATITLYLLATAAQLWIGSAERLLARRALIGLVLLHAAVFAGPAILLLVGNGGQSGVPEVSSWFGVVYFESLVFAIGTSIFLVAVVRERIEVRHRTAARIDPLTGASNRRDFTEQLRAALEHCRRTESPLSLLMFDLDHFKRVNDGFGHGVGDRILVCFAAVTQRVLRPNDRLGRLGGEEFAAVLPGCSIEAAHAIAERVRASFAETCRFVDGLTVSATVSAGVVQAGATDIEIETLLDRADRALYAAKAAGRNRVQSDAPASSDRRVVRVA